MTDKKWKEVREFLIEAERKNFVGSEAIFNNGKLKIYLAPSANPEWMENRLANVVGPLIKKAYGDVEFEYGWLSEMPAEQVAEREKIASIEANEVINKQDNLPFFMVRNALFRDGHAAKMKPTGLAVYLCLLMHADNESKECWPSYNTIAKLVGQSRRNTIRTIYHLVELEYISVSHHGENGRFTSNIISILNFPNITIP